jgi:transcriptional regulator with XRE-family HTH domain
MTQEQFAEALDMSVGFLSLIERGGNAPSFETLDKIGESGLECANKCRLMVQAKNWPKIGRSIQSLLWEYFFIIKQLKG